IGRQDREHAERTLLVAQRQVESERGGQSVRAEAGTLAVIGNPLRDGQVRRPERLLERRGARAPPGAPPPPAASRPGARAYAPGWRCGVSEAARRLLHRAARSWARALRRRGSAGGRSP